MVLVLQIHILKKDNFTQPRIKDTIFPTLNKKKKVTNMTRTFKIYSEWYLCYMFKSSISLLTDFKFPILNSRSIKIYKLLTKQIDKLSKNNRSLTFRYFQTLVSTSEHLFSLAKTIIYKLVQKLLTKQNIKIFQVKEV